VHIKKTHAVQVVDIVELCPSMVLMQIAASKDMATLARTRFKTKTQNKTRANSFMMSFDLCLDWILDLLFPFK
jgi:hypothetical protein